MGSRFFGRGEYSPAVEMYYSEGTLNSELDRADPHNGIIESVLESADEIAKTIKPGETFELPLDDIVTDIHPIDLDLGLTMEAGNHNLLVIEVGVAAVKLQVCNPSPEEYLAAD